MEENQELEQQQDQEQAQEQQQEEERRFTQAEVDAIINKRFAKMKRDMPSDEELAEFRAYKKAHEPQKNDADKLKDMTEERNSFETELEMMRRENFLLKQGVDADDVDYYVYKVTKAMGDDDDFEAAAKKFLKEQKPKTHVRVDMGGRLSSGSGGGAKTANQTMNDLIRSARN